MGKCGRTMPGPRSGASRLYAAGHRRSRAQLPVGLSCGERHSTEAHDGGPACVARRWERAADCWPAHSLTNSSKEIRWFLSESWAHAVHRCEQVKSCIQIFMRVGWHHARGQEMHGAYRGDEHSVDLRFGALGARADQPEPAHHHAELGPVNLARPVRVKKIECAAQCRARARLEGGAC